MLAALADPRLVSEKRDPQSSVVAIVLDKSGSQTIGGRMRQTAEAQERLEAALAALGGFETRIVTVGDDPGNGGTQAFAALAQGLKDVAPQRLGGAILVTDGIVHDIPQSLDALGFKAPLHALITGHAGERDRRIELVEAPRFGIVGKEQTLRARVVDTAGGSEPVTIEIRRDGARQGDVRVLPGQVIDIPVKIEHGGANVVELDTPAVPGELTELDQQGGGADRGRARPAQGFAGLGRAASGRARLAQSAARRRQCGAGAFHHPAPAGEARRRAGQRIVADRIPHGGPFWPQDRRIRSHHLRSLFEPDAAPSVYFQNIARFVDKGGAFLAAVGPDYAGSAAFIIRRSSRCCPRAPTAISPNSRSGRKSATTAASTR